MNGPDAGRFGPGGDFGSEDCFTPYGVDIKQLPQSKRKGYYDIPLESDMTPGSETRCFGYGCHSARGVSLASHWHPIGIALALPWHAVSLKIDISRCI